MTIAADALHRRCAFFSSVFKLQLSTFFHEWNGDPAKWASHLGQMLVHSDELSVKLFDCTRRNIRRMAQDGRFPPPSMRSASGNSGGVWFVQTVEYWLAKYTELEDQHPENASRENAEQATVLSIAFDSDLKNLLQRKFRDGVKVHAQTLA